MRADPVTILVDVAEGRSRVPAFLESLGVEIEYVTLTHGDYLVGPERAVERKSVADLHRSIANARLWSQLEGLRRLERAYVVVEGENLDDGPISHRGVRGAILQIIDNGVAVIRSSSPFDTAAWLRLLAVRGARDGPIQGNRGRRVRRHGPESLLLGVPGVSPAIARRLIERYGSIAAIAEAPLAEVQRIEGMGPVRARALRTALLGTFPRSGKVPKARLRAPPSRSASPEVPVSPARIGRSRGT